MDELKQNQGSVDFSWRDSNAPKNPHRLNMNVAAESNEEKGNVPSNKNTLLVRAKTKLPAPIKAKIKRLGAVWLEAHQAYGIPLAQQNALKELLDPWKANICFAEAEIDLSVFSSVGKAQNGREIRESILREQIYRDSSQFICDVQEYNPSLSEDFFDEKPSTEGKTPLQVQKEAELYEQRQSILSRKRDLEQLMANSVKMKQGDNPFFLDENGLWYLSDEGKLWISSPLQVTARIRDEHGLNHGKLIEFNDADGVHHTWAMPMEMLAGDCSDFRSTLMNAGLEVSTSHKARILLADYVQRAAPSYTARCVSRTGWHRQAFILPNESIGNTGQEKILVQGKTCNFRGYCASGTLLDWQTAIADRCVGNSRLIFSVSVAFAAPLLHLMEVEGGGFHLRSQSSSGKTTALRVAASVYGDKTFMRKWKATVNGLETIAFQHNDTLLCLDEIGETSAHSLGEAAYMLANGSGKGRSRADGGLRDTLTWKLLFLSSGEISLTAHMEEAGKRIRAGQEVRLAEIPVDTGKYGVFENLHGFPNGAAFSEALTRDAQRYYGTAIREFLKKVTEDPEGAKSLMATYMKAFLSYVPENSPGQILRVAGRFALVAAAGELATHYGITGIIGQDGLTSLGWEQADAVMATVSCFEDWLEAFGGPNPQEETKLLAEVSYFLEQHAESRFSEWGTRGPEEPGSHSRTHNRAGFRRPTTEGTEFYVFPETFKRDICKGHEEKFVKQTLFNHGLLKKDSEGKFTCSAKPLSETKARRFYVITLPTEKEEETP
jgi:putative DNA primase/helicase